MKEALQEGEKGTWGPRCALMSLAMEGRRMRFRTIV